MTRQREILLELIDQSGRHLDARELYHLASAREPKINRVTVYRTIKKLKEAGLIEELDLMHWEGDQHYYETRMKAEHAHAVCMCCGRVQELYGSTLRRIRKEAEVKLGFKVSSARLELGGYCKECSKHPTTPGDTRLEGNKAKRSGSG